jgi:mRNA interferase RelE/StbE
VAKAVIYARQATRVLTRMPRNTERLIRSKIELYAAEPAALANNVKALQGSHRLRLRVGNWRVVFTTDAERIIVEDVGARGSIYD